MSGRHVEDGPGAGPIEPAKLQTRWAAGDRRTEKKPARDKRSPPPLASGPNPTVARDDKAIGGELALWVGILSHRAGSQ